MPICMWVRQPGREKSNNKSVQIAIHGDFFHASRVLSAGSQRPEGSQMILSVPGA